MADQSKEGLNRRMEEIRKKNELLMKRRKEVLADQRQAEESGASITNILKTQKGARQNSDSDTEEKVPSYPVSNPHERAWDKGKKAGNDGDYEEKENPYEHGGWNSWKSYNRDKRRGRGNYNRGSYNPNSYMRGNKQGHFSASKPAKTFSTQNISTSAKQEWRGSYSGKEWKPKLEGDSRASSWQSRNRRAQFRGRGKGDNETYLYADVNQPMPKRGDFHRQATGGWRGRYQSGAEWNTVQGKESNIWRNNEAIKGQSNAWSDLSDSEDNHVPDLKMQKFLSDVEKYSNLGNTQKEHASNEEIAVSYEAVLSEQESQIDFEGIKNEYEALTSNAADGELKVYYDSNSGAVEVNKEKNKNLQKLEFEIDLPNLDRWNKNKSNVGVTTLGNGFGHYNVSQGVSKEECSGRGKKNRMDSMFITEGNINYEKYPDFTQSVLDKNNHMFEQTEIQNFELVSQSDSRTNVQNTRHALPEDVENDKENDLSLSACSNQISDLHAYESEISSSSAAKLTSSFNMKVSTDCSDEQELHEKQITSLTDQNNVKDCEVASSVMNDDKVNGQGVQTFLQKESSEKALNKNGQNQILAFSEATADSTLPKSEYNAEEEADSTLCNADEAADSTLPRAEYNAEEEADSTLLRSECNAEEEADSTLLRSEYNAEEEADSTLLKSEYTADGAADSTSCNADGTADSTSCNADGATDSILCDADGAGDAILCDIDEAVDSTLSNAIEAANSTLCNAAEATASILCNAPGFDCDVINNTPSLPLCDVSETSSPNLCDASKASSPFLCDVDKLSKDTSFVVNDAPIVAEMIDEKMEKLVKNEPPSELEG